ncbi:MAG TPA: L-seryl-tRNA(Sec) selenium transferase [Terracidiphilus sp.]|nr:L-seryl-tRNA(Sec) selenium transferase [Terracidiphilus sp.]
MEIDIQSLYQQLPQVGEFLDGAQGKELQRRYPRPFVLDAVRFILTAMREEIASGVLNDKTLTVALSNLAERVEQRLQMADPAALRPVINATGVILQTNLGRAPLSEAAIERIAAVSRGYCNLEFDLESGERGRRGGHVEDLLLRLVGLASPGHSALIVNNCAAATFLALNSLAEGGEVIVSRGELVEIGGGFRVPEILRKSGARLVEVGTTNRTRLEDYAAAITSETRLILRVHRSNFQIVGFTEEAELRDLVKLGSDAGVPVVVDQGTGCVLRPGEFGLSPQSSLLENSHSGAALVCASGDKLLGGPQCGIIVGESGPVRRLRVNPLHRAFRVDKLTLAALEATLLAYLSGQAEAIPVVGMISQSADAIRTRCERWAAALCSAKVKSEAIATQSAVGGGTTPGATLPSFAVALESHYMKATELAALLRRLEPPVIARIHNDQVLLDLRTVPEFEDDLILRMLSQAFESKATRETAGTGTQ